MNIDPEMLLKILEDATVFLMKFFGISLPDIIAQLQPLIQAIIALFA
ncbi:MAG: hypothetical protein GXZ02_09090 [Clostridiales bacterium]|nr:hypothetical protein [Clostridiales bacterium]